MNILSKEQILASADIKTEDVLVSEWGGTVRVAVMSGRLRDRFLDLQGAGPKPVSESQALLLVLTIVDEVGRTVFSEGDIEALREKNQDVLDRLGGVAMRINGMAMNAVEQAGKNSEAAPSGVSGSDSPLPSESQ